MATKKKAAVKKRAGSAPKKAAVKKRAGSAPKKAAVKKRAGSAPKKRSSKKVTDGSQAWERGESIACSPNETE